MSLSLCGTYPSWSIYASCASQGGLHVSRNAYVTKFRWGRSVINIMYRGLYRGLYRGFERKGGSLLGYNIIVVVNRQ
jgi:hypothetical protein